MCLALQKRASEKLTTGFWPNCRSNTQQRLTRKPPSKVGKQLGAFAILAGSLIPKDRSVEAHPRLVRVETGEILFACAHRLDGMKAEDRDATSAKEGLRKRLVNTSWRFNKGDAIMTYLSDGAVTCTQWNRPGKWTVEVMPLHKQGLTMAEIAKRLGKTPRAVWNVVNGRTPIWKPTKRKQGIAENT